MDPNAIVEVVSSKEETAAFNMDTMSEQLPESKAVNVPLSVASNDDLNDLYKDFVSVQAVKANLPQEQLKTDEVDNLSEIPSIKSYHAPEDENLVDEIFMDPVILRKPRLP